MINGRWKDGNKPEVDVTHLRAEAEAHGGKGMTHYKLTEELQREQAQMRDEYHAMEERVEALEDERDRLREALETIVDHTNGERFTDISDYLGAIARAALQETNDG